MYGAHCLRTWSATQGAIALSSAEAEFYALVDGALRARWAQTVLSELGCPASEAAELCAAELCTDSSAAKSFISRRGLGKMRHLEVRDLWLQKEVCEGRILVSKVSGNANPADAMTKFLSESELRSRLEILNLHLTWVCSSKVHNFVT